MCVVVVVVVCVWGGGRGPVNIIVLTLATTVFPKIYRVYPGALMRQLIEYAILRGLVVPCMVPGVKTCVRASLKANMSPKNTQLNTISYIFLPKSN